MSVSCTGPQYFDVEIIHSSLDYWRRDAYAPRRKEAKEGREEKSDSAVLFVPPALEMT